ncbi:TPR repeat-containing protein YrrB [bacterium BMS3Abin05]|nr:TPR repeat-containing protein YrrB [bacterium BMS3Abin05]GBE28932.1 TPR repeat-containing protein YrrB [bacterium BMS3Bbin03]HDL78945.1 tetratricopeptide repeat protein [Bacteroidota bacterium]
MNKTLQKNDAVKALNQKALVFYKQKRYDEAIAIWQNTFEKDPLNKTALYSLGIVFFEQKKYEEACVYLKKVTEIAPDHHKALLILGSAYLRLRKFDIAEDYIKKSLSLNPENKMAYLNLGAIYSVRKEGDYGIQMFEKALQIDNTEVRAYLGLGKIYAFKEDYQKANLNFKKIIEISPNSSIAAFAKKALLNSRAAGISSEDIEHYFMDGFRFYLGNYLNESIDNYEKYLHYRPKDDLIHYYLAEACLRKKDFKKSFLAFKKAIFINPKKGLYYKELGLLLDRFGKPNDVLEVLKKAAEFGKEDTVTFTLIGKNLNKLKRIKESIPNLKKALELDKNNILARYELARAYIENGDFEMGNHEIQTILEMPLKSPLKSQAEKLLNTINQSYTITKN